MGEGTSLARPQVLVAREEVRLACDGVLAAREGLDEELIRLEASVRAAVDIPSKVKRHPVKTAGLVGGAAFIALRGPRRVLRGTRNVIFGRPAPLPKSMLPREIDESLKRLGSDGDRVRGLLEHEFASYLVATEPARRGKSLRGSATIITIAFIRPFVVKYSRRLADQIFATDGNAYAARLGAVRARLGGDEEKTPD